MCGIPATICYGLSIGVPLPFKLDYLLFFAFGPFFLASVYAIYRYLRSKGEGIDLDMMLLFLIAAGISFTLMATMQGFIRGAYRDAMAAALDDEAREQVRIVFRHVDSTQQGLDMAFDLFISTGTFLLGLVLFRRRDYGPWYGLPGMIVAAGGLTLNLIAFPEVNAGSAGMIDPAPFFAVWFSVLALRFVWDLLAWKEDEPANSDSLSVG